MRRCLNLCLLVALIATAASSGNAQRYSVSIPHLKLADGERVVGFELHVESGRVAAVPNIPIGWSLSIDNDASWNTSLKALVTVGAAALDDKFFRGFVIVEKDGHSSSPFSVHCDVSVTRDFVMPRTIHLLPREVVLESVSD